MSEQDAALVTAVASLELAAERAQSALTAKTEWVREFYLTYTSEQLADAAAALGYTLVKSESAPSLTKQEGHRA